ncbi:MAG: hypothetical protein QW478_15425, partial [Candidatus Micrarchaeaceae archaeon]
GGRYCMAKSVITKTPDAIVQRWQTNLANAGATITAGVNALKTAPGQSAAAAKQDWIAAMTNKAVQDRWATQVAAVTLQQWQQAMIQKGIPNLQNGVANAKTKMTNFITWLVNTENQLLPTIDAMPSLTLQQRIARATAWMQGMNKTPYKGYQRT